MPVICSLSVRVWLLLCALSLGAVVLAYRALNVAQIEFALVHGGYYFVGGLWFGYLACWVWVMRGPERPHFILPRVSTALLLLMASLAVISADEWGNKILFDEVTLNGTAMNMHYYREASTIQRAFWFDDSFVATMFTLDKRPLFFPFLVSLVHDLTGYRAENSIYLNLALVPVLLGTVYHLAWRMAGRFAGLCTVALLVTFPLLAQNATCGAMELQNLTMISGTILAAMLYYDRPESSRLALLCISSALLSQCRYESIIFAVPTVAVILAGWLRSRRAVLSPVLWLTPFLFVPAVWLSRFVDASPVRWELKPGQTSRFSIDYFQSNVEGLLRFLYVGDIELPNSVFLAVLATLCILLVLAFALFRRLRPRLQSFTGAHWVFVLYAVTIALVMGLMLFYYWARLDDPMASRFSLSFYMAAALGTSLVITWLARRYSSKVYLCFWLLWVCNLLVSFCPKVAMQIYTDENPLRLQLEWEQAVYKDLPKMPRLVLASKTSLNWITNGVASVPIWDCNRRWEQVKYQMRAGTWSEIIAIQTFKPASGDGEFYLASDDRLPEGVSVIPFATKRFGPRICRISRVVIEPKQLAEIDLKSSLRSPMPAAISH